MRRRAAHGFRLRGGFEGFGFGWGFSSGSNSEFRIVLGAVAALAVVNCSFLLNAV